MAKETPENGAGDATKTTNNGESPNNGDSPAKLPRDNTMVTTAEVSACAVIKNKPKLLLLYKMQEDHFIYLHSKSSLDVICQKLNGLADHC